MSDPLETSELMAFVKTFDARSLSRAAAELGVPRATISRRLARLEERLGVRLLRRTTRSLVLTDAGDAFLRSSRVALEAVERAEESVRRTDDAVRGDLRISAPPISSPAFHAMMCDFAARHPKVRLHVHTSSRVVDMKRDGYDVAIRAGSELEPGLIARVLMRDPLVTVASPRYLEERGVPLTARDLRKHRLLLGFARGELPASHWPRAGGGKLHVEGTFVSNDIGLLAAAAEEGLGIALLPWVVVSGLVESGKLVRVLAGVVEGTSSVAVVYPEREFVPPQVKAFVETVTTWAPKSLAESARERFDPGAAGCEEKAKRAKGRRASRHSSTRSTAG